MSLVCIACSIFHEELQRLRTLDPTGPPVKFLSSMLHLTPELLDRELQELIAQEKVNGNRVVLAFGDCCAHMTDFEQAPDVVRTAGINCCEVLLGSEVYRKLRKEGAFFIMPEWALRWQQVFETGLGLNPANAKELMQDMHSRLIYLDTGQIPIPQDKLVEMVEYTGLPLEILRVSMEPFRASLRDCQRRLEEP